jgi:glycosyltransferase involved in cell wall biosynthesis
MYKGHTVATILPCYNVGGFVRPVIETMPAFVDTIIAIDDASTDDTLAVLRAIQEPRLIVITHRQNTGVGGAMITGLQCGAEGGSDILVKVDGDGQMSTDLLPMLLDPIIDEGYEYAKGNRLRDRRALKAMPAVRRFGNFALTFLTKLASGYWRIMDPQNGYVAIRRTTWLMIDPSCIYNGYFFENDMLINLNILSARVKDVPMPARYQGEPSSLRVGHIIPTFAWLLVRRTLYRFITKYVVLDFSPIALFILTGLPLFLWGVGFGAWSWWHSAREGVFASTGVVMLSVLPLLIGFELLLNALVLDINESPR